MTTIRYRRPLGPTHPVTAGLVVSAITVLLSGCATTATLPQDPGLHPRLTPYTYIEEGNLVAVTVDTSAATRREKSDYIPLPFSIANKTLDRLTLTRESFTLVDEQGNKYPLASVAEGRAIGNRMSTDYKVAANYFDAVAGTFQGYRYQAASFFPFLGADPLGQNRGLVRDQVQLGQRMWTTDMLYFPHPKGTITGKKFELWVTAPELTEPVFVKFRIG